MTLKPAVRIVFAPIARRGARKADPLPTQGDACGRVIRLDPRMPNVGKVLLHELLHVQHPSWSEDRVLAVEELRWGRLGWREKARLLQMLGSARIEGEETV